MTKVTEAIYSAGVLQPVEDLALTEGQRVRLIVELLDDRPKDRAAAFARLKAGIAAMRCGSIRTAGYQAETTCTIAAEHSHWRLISEAQDSPCSQHGSSLY